MLRHKAQQKSVRQSATRRTRNITQKSAQKTAVKKAHAAIGTESENIFVRLAQKAIDKLQAHGIIHKNTAARRKSRLMKKANKAKAQKA